MANFFSSQSRIKTGSSDEIFLGEDKEWLIIYTKELSQTNPSNYFIFGHRHYPLDLKINDKARYINLGDWIRSNTYAVFDGNDLQLKKWEA
jgi:UDP-2,3-diacylglucosamine hydrolase